MQTKGENLLEGRKLIPYKIGVLVLLAIVGLLQPVGGMFKFYSLLKWGHALGISPGPVPFTNIKGYEVQNLSFFLEYEYGHEDRDNKKRRPHRLDLDWKTINSIEGPDSRRLVYLFALGLLPGMEERKFVSRILWASFCPGGAFSAVTTNWDGHSGRKLVIEDGLNRKRYEFSVECGNE